MFKNAFNSNIPIDVLIVAIYNSIIDATDKNTIEYLSKIEKCIFIKCIIRFPDNSYSPAKANHLFDNCEFTVIEKDKMDIEVSSQDPIQVHTLNYIKKCLRKHFCGNSIESNTSFGTEKQYTYCLIEILNNLMDVFKGINDAEENEIPSFNIQQDCYVCIEPLRGMSVIKDRKIFLKSIIGEIIQGLYKNLCKDNPNNKPTTHEEDIINEINNYVSINWNDEELKATLCFINPYSKSMSLILLVNSLYFCTQISIHLSHLPLDLKTIEIDNKFLSEPITKTISIDYQSIFDSITDVENLVQENEIKEEDVERNKTDCIVSFMKNTRMIESVETIFTERPYQIYLEDIYQSILIYRKENLIKLPIKIYCNLNLCGMTHVFNIAILRLMKLRLGQFFNHEKMKEEVILSEVLKILMTKYCDFQSENKNSLEYTITDLTSYLKYFSIKIAHSYEPLPIIKVVGIIQRNNLPQTREVMQYCCWTNKDGKDIQVKVTSSSHKDIDGKSEFESKEEGKEVVRKTQGYEQKDTMEEGMKKKSVTEID